MRVRSILALLPLPIALAALVTFSAATTPPRSEDSSGPNVLFLISDDLTATALSCYGNEVCSTPSIDSLAERGTRFTRAYCQGTYCGPSRASFMSGYYPHAIRMLGYQWPRKNLGDRASWAQHFKDAGYTTARVGKIYHLGVPGGVEKGGDGADDPPSWTERYNCQGPEWKAPGEGETLEGNPDGTKPVMGGNTFVVVEAEGDDLVHADGKASAKACELLERFARDEERFFLAVGFVRPHVPFVAPIEYYEPYPPEEMVLPEKVPGDWDDIPKAGINYKTSVNMKMDVRQQKRAVSAYYASVAFMDAQVGKVLDTLDSTGLSKNTLVIFTSDHGYHLGEHDFWAKVSLHEESAAVPLILAMPDGGASVTDSFAELLDLFPTTASLCGLEVPDRIQGLDLSRVLEDPEHDVRETAFCVNGKGFLLRDDRWAYIQYGEDGGGGAELFDMHTDSLQYENLVDDPDHQATVEVLRERLADKLRSIRDNDLGLDYR